MKMKVLVTGATGFLGNHLVRVLLKKGFRVIVFLRPSSDISILAGLECTVLRGDLTNPKDLDAAVKGCDYVIHSAALTSQNITDFEVYRRANLEPTQKLVRASQKHKVKRFVYISTANSFTPGSIENPGDESTGFMEQFKDAHYAYSKYLAQKFVTEQAKKMNFPGVVVAPTFMIGPYDPKPSSGALILYILKNRLLIYPRGGKSFVDVRAVATATVNALSMGKEGESYILSGRNLTYREFYQKILDVTSREKKLIPLPKKSWKLVKAISLVLPFKKLKLLNVHMRNLLIDNYFSNQKAKQELAMPSTELEPLLKETVKWFRENGYLD